MHSSAKRADPKKSRGFKSLHFRHKRVDEQGEFDNAVIASSPLSGREPCLV